MQSRWSIEVSHRQLKQTCGISYCQSLAPAEVVALHADETSGSEPEGELDQAIEEERVEDEAISDAAEVDTEYVDDPQIDLLSA